MPDFTRPDGRTADEPRPITIETGFQPHAEGSVLITSGNTHVICSASVEESVPRWMRGKGQGWVTAEYGMLPRATNTRSRREASAGKQGGRTQEIQRLIGRSLRGVVDLSALGERSITVDCDVVRADGGTRTASITGAYVALYQAFDGLVKAGEIEKMPLTDQIAAVSCGIYKDTPVLDLDYDEDSVADTDANFVLTGAGGIVEIQGTAEGKPFSEDEFLKLMALAKSGIQELATLQREALGIAS